MHAFKQLENLITDLPGIGPRQAKRIIYYLLGREPKYSFDLSEYIKNVRLEMRLCQETFSFFYPEEPNQKVSNIALDKTREHDRVLVVETDNDLHNIERLNIWRGTYFVLGGTIPVHSKEYEKYIRYHDLQRILSDKAAHNGLSEIILGTSTHPAGENTARVIADIASQIDITVSKLGRGLSTGTTLEYIDSKTFESALERRE